MRWLPGFLRGGRDELGWDDLIRRVVESVSTLSRYAERGRVAFPQDVLVTVEVSGGSIDVVQRFTEKPEFDAAIGAALANACDCSESELPGREYLVAAADRTRVVATEGAARVWELVIEGGDCSGSVLALPAGRPELRFGRGEWHGPDKHLRNDLVVCEKTEFVSRRAGRITLGRRELEVEALDQGDALVVRRAGGDSLRPARTAKGRAAVRSGDAIELIGRGGETLRLLARRITVEESESRGRRHA